MPYRALGLALVLREDGTAAGIHGGPSGDAGDLWFDIGPTNDRGQLGPWVVESTLWVFCRDAPERGGSNNHALARFEGSADTPEGVVDILEAHVSLMGQELKRHPREVITGSPHAALEP